MLDLVPLAGPWGQMTDGHPHARVIHERLQFKLPESDPIAIASPAVRTDQQPFWVRILVTTHGLPPAAKAAHGKAGRIMVAPDIDPSQVLGYIVNPVRNGLGFLRVNKIVNLHLLRFPSGVPPSALVGIRPHEFLLLGVYRDDGVALLQEMVNVAIEMLKLP